MGTNNDLIGRQDILLQLRRATTGDAFELVGSSGSGKTAIVRELAKPSPDRSPDLLDPVHIDLEAFDPERPGDRGPDASVGSVQASFHHFAALLTHLVRTVLGDDQATGFEAEVLEAYQSEVAGRRVYSLALAMEDVRFELSPAALAAAWRDSKDAVAAAFLRRWNGTPGDGNRFLVFDTVDDIIDEEIGLWLTDLLPGLERTVVLLTRRSPAAGHPSAEGDDSLVPETMVDRFIQIPVGPFSGEDLDHYLVDRRSSVQGFNAKLVHAITGGHPGTVVVMHELIERPTVEEFVLRDLLEEASRSERNRIALLVKRLVQAQSTPPEFSRMSTEAKQDFGAVLWRVVQAVSVPRQFDNELFTALMVGEDLHGIPPEELFAHLPTLPFIEAVNRPDIESDTVFRVYRYVREDILDRLFREESARIRTLHARAATHHNARLLDEGEEGLTHGYEDARVYESPLWISHKREWLYHRAYAVDDEDRNEAVREAARLFLEAFWWWGSYIHFDFCDRIVADLGQMLKRQPDRSRWSTWESLEQLQRGLSGLLASYPPRSTKREADWDAVEASLLVIQKVCRPAGEPTPADFKVAALIRLFLAHSFRFRPDDPDAATGPRRLADEHYAKVIEALGRSVARGADPDDDWNVPWIHFERADLAFEAHADVESPRSHWLAAAALLQPPDAGGSAVDDLFGDTPTGGDGPPDDELIANMHRLRGDLCWQAGDTDRAARWYRRSALHAYLSHGTTDVPDEYTLQYYVEIRARILNRIEELKQVVVTAADAERDEARRRLVAFAVEVAGAKWCDFRTGGRPEAAWRAEVEAQIGGDQLFELPLLDTASTLFLEGPKVDELGSSDSDFMGVFLSARAAAGAAAGDDLHDERWP